ncbi:MAG TPA: hypothetical protein PK546_04315 [Chitinophagales bacterium]|jgi:hypothetical protein|nr:hypothetical protein [Chitinophagales bacterium]HPN18741.1 hypothetical protein [Chitinophagales bacterium]
MSAPNQLSNLQLELLKIYSTNISDEKLLKIKSMLANFFAEEATKEMDKFIEENNITQQDLIDWTHEHNRVKTGN